MTGRYVSSCSVDKNLWLQKGDPSWPDVPVMKSLISGSDQIGNRCLANRKDEQGGISILLHNAGAVARKEEVVELPIFRQAQFDHNNMRRWSREVEEVKNYRKMVFGKMVMMALHLAKT